MKMFAFNDVKYLRSELQDFFNRHLIWIGAFLMVTMVFLSRPILNKDKTKREKLHFVISGGSVGGNYNLTSNCICASLNRYFSEPTTEVDVSFTCIASNGSNDNMDNLHSGFADFALTQRNVLLNKLYDEKNGMKNIQVIIPLFRERLLIYTKNDKNISFDDFKEKIESRQGKKFRVGVTSKDGYSFESFSQVSRLQGLDLTEVDIVENTYGVLEPNLIADSIQAIVAFTMSRNLLDDDPSISKVFFSKQQVDMLASRMRFLGHSRIETINNESSEEYTLSSMAFLVGSNESVNRLESAKKIIPDILIESYSGGDICPQVKDNIESAVAMLNSSEATRDLEGVLPMNQSLLSHLKNGRDTNRPISSYFSSQAKIIGGCTIITVLAIFIFLITSRYQKIRQWLKGGDNIQLLWYRYKHIFISLTILISLYILSERLLLHGEQTQYEKIPIKSQLLNMTSWDRHVWLITSSLTGYHNEIFPLSLLGKIMISFSAGILWIGTFFVAITEQLFRYSRSKRKKGTMKIKFADHVVITGWNEGTDDMIEKIFHHGKRHIKNIVCVASNPAKIIKGSDQIKKWHSLGRLHFVEGDARETSALGLANVHKARSVVLLAEDMSMVSDEKTLLRAHAITRYCEKMKRKVVKNGATIGEAISSVSTTNYQVADPIYIIAEVNNHQFKTDLENAHVNELVSCSTFRHNMIIQSILNPGASDVVNDMIEFDEYSELYNVDLSAERNNHLLGKTFDELLVGLRKQNILLMGVKVTFKDNEDKEIIDREKIHSRLKEINLDRQTIINPVTITEVNRRTQINDYLVVLALDKQELLKGLKRVVISNEPLSTVESLLV